MLIHPALCPSQGPQEPTPEYSSRVLRYALTYGPEPLTLAQLDLCDGEAQRAVCRLPRQLDDHAAQLDATLHRLRLQIAGYQTIRRAQAAQEARTLAALAQDTPDDLIAPTTSSQPSAQGIPDDPQTRAIRLLRAALVLIMDGNGDDGGKGARLTPPVPQLPPSGIALPERPHPPKDGIKF